MAVWSFLTRPQARTLGRGELHGDRLWATLARWRHRRRSRLDLEALSDDMLRDIGLSREQAEREAEKPFWRP